MLGILLSLFTAFPNPVAEAYEEQWDRADLMHIEGYFQSLVCDPTACEDLKRLIIESLAPPESIPPGRKLPPTPYMRVRFFHQGKSIGLWNFDDHGGVYDSDRKLVGSYRKNEIAVLEAFLELLKVPSVRNAAKRNRLDFQLLDQPNIMQVLDRDLATSNTVEKSPSLYICISGDSRHLIVGRERVNYFNYFDLAQDFESYSDILRMSLHGDTAVERAAKLQSLGHYIESMIDVGWISKPGTLAKRHEGTLVEELNEPCSAALDRDGQRLYVLVQKSGALLELQKQDDILQKFIALEKHQVLTKQSDHLGSVIISPDDRHLYVNSPADRKIVCLRREQTTQRLGCNSHRTRASGLEFKGLCLTLAEKSKNLLG